MRSSTSNSSPGAGGRRQQARRAIAGFFGLLVVLVAAGAIAWRWVPEAFRSRWVPEAYQPIASSSDLYLSLYRSDAVEHYVHYHGTDPEVERSLRAAEVLFVGTSRMMLGFDPDVLARYFRERGLRHYLMGFAFGESVPLTTAVMQRADLRPKWVIANVDGFFYANPSRYGWEVLHSSRANAWQVAFEAEATFGAIRTFHRWFPYAAVDRTKSVWMRSRVDGRWLPHFVPGESKVFASPPRLSTPLDAQVLKVAKAFLEDCSRRGARLVLTFVPSPVGHREQAEALARELGVPLVSPVLEGLESYDGSHLTSASAARFTEAFLRDLSPVIGGAGTAPR